LTIKLQNLKQSGFIFGLTYRYKHSISSGSFGETPWNGFVYELPNKLDRYFRAILRAI